LQDPFPEQLNAKLVDTYVIADDYTSPWDFKQFQKYKGGAGNVKQWMDRYFAEKSPALDWHRHLQKHTTAAIRKCVSHDVENMMRKSERWPSESRQFFELYRFDFVFDDKVLLFMVGCVCSETFLAQPVFDGGEYEPESESFCAQTSLHNV
jgi:hypothetical protein